MPKHSGPKTPAKSHPGSLLIICAAETDFLKRLALSCRISPSELVLVSPRPVSFPGLLNDTPLRHMAGVLDEKSGEVELIAYNFPDLVSLASPTAALKTLLPGLREKERIAASKIDYGSLQAALKLSLDPLTIWIDLPGEEAAILDALAKIDVLDRTEEIVLRCGVEAFFVGADDEAHIRQRLMERGFAVTATNDDDPDWPELVCCADLQARRIAKLEGELETVASSCSGFESELRTTIGQLSAATAEREALRKALDQSRTTQETLDRTLSEMQATISARDVSLHASEATIEKLTAALTEARTVADARAKELAEAQALSQARFTYLNEAKAALATRDAELLESQKQKAALTSELDEARKSLAAKDTALVETRSLAEARRVVLEEAKASVAAKDKSLADQKLKSDADAGRIIELESKLRLAREELRRSEGQIAIIKDLLLREVGL